MSKSYYGVKKGNTVGIFDNWNEASASIYKYKGAMYKKFKTLEEAEDYMNSNEAAMSNRYETEEQIFALLKEHEVYAYVDGSNKGDASAFSWGVILFINGKKIKLSGVGNEKFNSYRNVAGELFASVNAVNYAIKANKKKIIICHDYSGIRHWALGEWKTKNELSKHYKNFFDSALKKIEVQFVKAEGHTGDTFNEEVDKLAKKALGIK